MCAITFRTLKDNQPAYLADLLVRPKCSKYLRSTNKNRFVVPRIYILRLRLGQEPVRNAKPILTFRKLLKSHLFDLAFSTLVPQQPGSLLTNLLWLQLWHMLTRRICAPLSSVRWGYRRSRSFVDWLIDWQIYNTQQTRVIHPMLFYCWSTIFDAGPTLKQHWVKASCLLDISRLSIINPANTRHWNNVSLMLAHRLRCWPSISQT